MSYRATLSTNAQADLRAMPRPVALYTVSQLRALEEDPVLLSRRSHFPFREKCQVFSFDRDYDGRRYFVNVLFQYGADEETLHIADIAWQAAEKWWDIEDDDASE